MNADLPFRILLLRSGRIFTDRINALLHMHDLNYSLWQVLYVIALAEQITLIDIAQELGISQPAVSKRIFELEQKQLIVLVPSQNRREKIVALSEQGQLHFQKCRKAIHTLEQHYLSGITDENLQQSKKTLTQFMNNLKNEDISHE